jgi:hypothetical protein
VGDLGLAWLPLSAVFLNCNLNRRFNWQLIVIAVLIGSALTAGMTILQPRFKGIPDLVCEILLLPES